MSLSLHTQICASPEIEYPVLAFNHCRDDMIAQAVDILE